MIQDCCFSEIMNPADHIDGDGYTCQDGHKWVVKDDGRGKYWLCEQLGERWGGPAGIPIRRAPEEAK